MTLYPSAHRRMLMPWAIGLVMLTVLPMLGSLILSLTNVDTQLNSRTLSWNGLEHYRTALSIDTTDEVTADDGWIAQTLGGKPRDPLLYASLYNSLFFTLFAVPLGLVTALAVAILLNQPVRGVAAFRALVYLPHVLGGVASIVIWSWLFNPQFGWINQAIRHIYEAVDPIVRLVTQDGTDHWLIPNWLYSREGCKPAVIIMSAWTMGASMLIFLAALRRVPRSLYDAAQLDGAGSWHRFLHMTLPQITPAILFNLVFGVIFSMQSFNEAYLLENRQQDDGLLFYVLYLYQTAFEPPYQLGYASALAWILLAVILLLVAPLLGSSRKWVHYQGAT